MSVQKRAVLESLRAAQSNITQKQCLKDMEEKIGCLEGRAKELESHNAIWAEKFVMEVLEGTEEDVYFLEMHTICGKEHIQNLKADVEEKKVQIDLLQGGLTKRNQEVRALKVELKAKEVKIKGFIKAERVTRQDVERFERKDEGRKIEEALSSKGRG
ncbi:hypothetical protein QFC21_005587 [Naganishia friedmannii]|uniref:Uncharacterized protein n=1 Tax=Naganishia friedmannii TaxID=89922 RepID=A0ACC2V9W1_9TREE|nr:hypothetical protein QFC21_005587 [Naganishia friedmannii]